MTLIEVQPLFDEDVREILKEYFREQEQDRIWQWLQQMREEVDHNGC